MDFKQILASQISETLKKDFNTDLDIAAVTTLFETPKDPKLGDIAFPCFPLARSLKKAPPQIAKELEEKLKSSNLMDNFQSVKATGPYLNFQMDRSQLNAQLIPAILNGDYLKPRKSLSKKVMVEYSQPNTHKAFHVGHTRNVALGDALVRLYEWTGHEVIAANYIGDVGAHIAKCLWYLTDFYLPSQEEIHLKELSDIVSKPELFQEQVFSFLNKNSWNKAEFLGHMYSSATDLLDFYSLSRTPFPGIVVALVKSITAHPVVEKWSVVEVEIGTKTETVVCGGTGYKVGNKVAYAKNGSRVAGRLVQSTDKKGTISNGMILSETEIELGEDKNKIFALDPQAEVGTEISELYRLTENQLNESVIETIQKRSASVSKTLKELEKPGSNYYKLWQQTRLWSLDEFQKIYSWIDARFDHYFYESDVGDSGKKIVSSYLESGVFKKDEGAIGVDLSDKKLPFFLLLKSDGTGLYSTKDLSLASLKFEKYGIDKSIYVVDVGQSLHFQQVFATLEKMGFEQAKDCFHLAYGMVVLPDGKMSSRKGTVVLFSDLKENLMNQVTTEYLEKYRGQWSDDEINDAAKKISIATIKYGMLNQDNNKNITFELSQWTAKSGNTGPYMMYAYARTKSILEEYDKTFPIQEMNQINWSLLSDDTELALVRKLTAFHDSIEKAVAKNEAQSLCIYLYELSKDFSRMYAQCSVMNAETDELKHARAALVNATGKVLKTGLSLIGITCLERM
ncbi:MAG: arginine--tRNA ligase [Bdellovibrionales bacterium]